MTKRPGYRNIGSIIRNNSAISELYSQSLEHSHLQKTVIGQLDPSFRDHIYVAGITENTLVIYSDNPAWAAKIRYSTAKIINTLQQHPRFKNIRTLRIRTDPSLDRQTTTSDKSVLSVASSTHLEEVAHNINDTALKNSLLKLAQNK
jgi:hypothetical protein